MFMTTMSAPAPTTDRAEAVLKVFQTAAHPLTLALAQKSYQGPSLSKKEFSRIVEDHLLMEGHLHKCSPSGRSARYWAQDEEHKVREKVRELLSAGALAESKVATAVNKALPKVSSPAAIKEFLQGMRQKGLLHEWPGKGKAKALALRPFDAVALVAFKTKTLEDLSGVLAKVEPLGVSVDQFLQVIRQRLRPLQPEPAPQAVATAPRVPGLNGPGMSGGLGAELDDLILKGMRDLDPAVQSGASVLLRDLRRHMPPEYRQHETFDAAVIRLAEQGRVVLHRHDQPSLLTAEERDELVRDESGTYFTSIAHRV
jgi:hypothetical protein